MNNKLEDFILLKLGELIGERKHRNESDPFAEVSFLYRDDSSPLNGDTIYFIWKVGNELHIVHSGSDGTNYRIATLCIDQFNGFGKSLSMAIAGILNAMGYNKIMIDEGD